MNKAICTVLLAPFFLVCSLADAGTRMLEQPALSEERLAFVYAGDIWVAGRDGSDPRRLTSSEADERNPSFSPDGQWIAFEGDYDDNIDVYVISAAGVHPRR